MTDEELMNRCFEFHYWLSTRDETIFEAIGLHNFIIDDSLDRKELWERFLNDLNNKNYE